MSDKIENLQLKEQKETNWILWVNTGATIITGLAAVTLSVIALLK